jgi:hypothetical protein
MGNNDPVQYESLKAKDVFEFFRILRVYQKSLKQK